MGSYTSFTLNRKWRRFRRNSRTWRIWFTNYFNRHVFGAWQKLGKMRWTFASWVFIVLVAGWGLISQIQTLGAASEANKPVSGGTYQEALQGEVKSVNPLFPENSATEDVISLVFSGLTKVDGKREIVADIAERWDVSADRKTYTFYLRNNLKWQDGIRLTTKDIAFTVDLLQNPDTRSPFGSNWSGVKYEVVNDNEIKFILPSSYGNFLANTTIGILPKHRLEGVKPSTLRSYEFNQRPVGSGPYRVELLEVDNALVELSANENYYIHKPYINKVVFQLSSDANASIDALIRRQVEAVAAVQPSDVKTVEKIEGINVYRIGLPAYVGAFFNMRSSSLANPEVRKALAYAVDRESIIQNNLSGEATKAYYPVPAGFVGFNPNAARYDYDQAKAKELLEKSTKEKLRLRLVTLSNSNYEKIAEQLASSWRKLGVEVEVIAADNLELQQNYIRSRNYDVLLYGQNLGLDSDVYSFWHSSQVNDPGLNISAYKNTDADKLLESGRLAKDQNYKATRYAGFVDIWAKDVPAVILYSPYYNYAQSDVVHGFNAVKISEPSDRFYNIYDWYIKK